MPNISQSLLYGLYPEGVIVRVSTYPAEIDLLFSGERELVKKSALERQKSFAKGRRCAKQCLDSLGITHFPILRGSMREPIWPEGIRGSITHCQGYSAAAVSASVHIASLGIDIEKIEDIGRLPREIVCTDEEQSWLEELSPPERSSFAYLIFSAKESLYKALFIHHRKFIEFTDVDIAVDIIDQSFTAHSKTEALAIILQRYAQLGRYCFIDQFVATGMTLLRK